MVAVERGRYALAHVPPVRQMAAQLGIHNSTLHRRRVKALTALRAAAEDYRRWAAA